MADFADLIRPETKKETTGPPVADPVMYYGVLGDIVKTAAPTTEADPVGIHVSLMAGTCAIIGPGPYVKIGNTRHPLLVSPLLFGRTGSGRKGEATDTAEVFLREAWPELSDFTTSGLSSGEGLIERIKDGDDSEDEERRKKRSRLLVVEPEFASVMARAKREGSTLAAVLRQAWDGRALSVLNRAALRASRSHIAIIGHIAPREFRIKLAETDIAGGTYNRFLGTYVERARRVALPEGVSHQTLSGLARRLNKAIRTAEQISAVTLATDAAQLWTDKLYDEFTAADDEDQIWTQFIRRAAPYCRRISALYAVLDGESEVSCAHLTGAAAVVRYSIDSIRYVLDSQLRDPKLDRIRRSIDAAGENGLTRSEVSQLFSRNVPAKVLDELLDQLVEYGTYEIIERRTRGRPATTYRRRLISSSFVPEPR